MTHVRELAEKKLLFKNIYSFEGRVLDPGGVDPDPDFKKTPCPYPAVKDKPESGSDMIST